MWPIVRKPTFPRLKNLPNKTKRKDGHKRGAQQAGERQTKSLGYANFLPDRKFDTLFVLYRSSHLIYFKFFVFVCIEARTSYTSNSFSKNLHKEVPFLYLIFYRTVMLKYYYFDFSILFCIFHFRLRKDL